MSIGSDQEVRVPPMDPGALRPRIRVATSLPAELPHYELLREIRREPDRPMLWSHSVVLDENFVPRLAVSSPPPFQPIDLAEVVGTAGPYEIEICTGKGRFLADYAQRHPDRGLVGIEWTRGIARNAAEKLERRLKGAHHARVIWGEALYFLRDRLPSGICSAVHLYFPDPWPTNRDRRVVQPELLAQIRRIALPGCAFHWATDHDDYNRAACKLLSSTEGFHLLDGNAPPTEGIRTTFESKYLAEGRPIHRSVWFVEPIVNFAS